MQIFNPPKISCSAKNDSDITGFYLHYDIQLPAGGDISEPNPGSVIKILSASDNSRMYSLRSFCSSYCFLYFGGQLIFWAAEFAEDLRSSEILNPGEGIRVSGDVAKLACFGWSPTGGDIVAGVFS